MKKILIRIIIVLQVLVMGAELVNGLYNTKDFSIELAEKKTEKKAETCEDDGKEKGIVFYLINTNAYVSRSHQYLEFSSRLYKAQLSRIEQPPNLS